MTNSLYQSLETQVGITDEVTECDCCGKQGLKRTVVFKAVEEADSFFYFLGTSCAKKTWLFQHPNFKKSNTKVNSNGLTASQQSDADREAQEKLDIEARYIQHVMNKFSCPEELAIERMELVRSFDNGHYKMIQNMA